MSSGSLLAENRTVTVGTKLEFTSALFRQRTNEDVDTIYVKYIEDGIMLGNLYMSEGSEAGEVHVIGIPDSHGRKPIIKLELNFIPNKPKDSFSLSFENLHLQYRHGRDCDHGQIFYAKRIDTYLDEFRLLNCEISNYARVVYRAIPYQDDQGENITGGWVRRFEVADCIIHDANIVKTNSWSCFYIGQGMMQCDIHDNVFYDLPYNRGIVQLVKIKPEYRLDTKFNFSNNLVAIATKRNNSPVLALDSTMSKNAKVTICDNIFLRPNWRNDYNLDQEDDGKEKRILRLCYGHVEAHNNVIDPTYGESASWEKDQKLDSLGNGKWLTNHADVGILPEKAHIAWSDFTAPEFGFFGLWKNLPIYRMGNARGPIGPMALFTNEKQSVVQFNAKIHGSVSAHVSVFPSTPKYVNGQSVELEVDTKGLGKFVRWSDGNTDNPRRITLNGDMSLTAECTEVPYTAVWNLEQLKKNNMKLDAPLKSNYTHTQNPYFIKYMTYNGKQYVDSTEFAFLTRNNKFAKREVPKNCLFIHTDVHTLDKLKKADYITIDLGQVKAGDYISFYIATETYMCAKTNIDYSLDGGKSWKNFHSFFMDPKQTATLSGVWKFVQAQLPPALDGKNVTIRIMGDAGGARFIGKDVLYMAELCDDDVNDYLTYEFLYLADIRLGNGPIVKGKK